MVGTSNQSVPEMAIDFLAAPGISILLRSTVFLPRYSATYRLDAAAVGVTPSAPETMVDVSSGTQTWHAGKWTIYR